MPSPRFYSCVLCSKRPKKDHRRRLDGQVNKSLRKYLQKQFFIDSSTLTKPNSVICVKCRQSCCREISKTTGSDVNTTNTSVSTDEEYIPPLKYSRLSEASTCKSPPSITLKIPSAGGSHSQCVACKRHGLKLVVVPANARFHLFLDKVIILPTGARCCPGHLVGYVFSPDIVETISETRQTTAFNRSDLLQLITQIRNIALKNSRRRIDFDTENALSDSDILNLTGLTKTSFDDLSSILQQSKMRDSHTRTVRTCFVPLNLGFEHVTRDRIIKDHTRPLAQSLFGNFTNPAILIVDGTYIYIEKSAQFKFQRRCYSLHKHRPLVKPMVFVSTIGYIVSVIGPYYSDAKNNDAKILNHIMNNNLEEIKSWLTDDDVLIVDRGFRDSLELLTELGINTEMPAFLKKGEKQMTVEESNTSRLITKLRWVVESVNGRIKLWKYLDKVLPNSQIPYIGDYVKIVCSIMNKYWSPLSTGIFEDDERLGAKMLYLSKQKNSLFEKIQNEGLDKRASKWIKIDASGCVANFPRLCEDDIRNMTLGVYQLKMARSYTKEHLDNEGNYEVFLYNEDDHLICAKIQSRHTSAKMYRLWILYDDCSVTSWYCQCKAGTRVVGTCSHVTSVVWYLGLGRYFDKLFENNRDWTKYLLDAQNMPDPEPVDESDNEHIADEE